MDVFKREPLYVDAFIGARLPDGRATTPGYQVWLTSAYAEDPPSERRALARVNTLRTGFATGVLEPVCLPGNWPFRAAPHWRANGCKPSWPEYERPILAGNLSRLAVASVCAA